MAAFRGILGTAYFVLTFNLAISSVACGRGDVYCGHVQFRITAAYMLNSFLLRKHQKLPYFT